MHPPQDSQTIHPSDSWQHLAQTLWQEYLQAHRQAMTALLQEVVDPLQRVETLAKLSLALDRTFRALEQGQPAISPLSIARQVLERQAEFIQRRYPSHLTAFLEILEPFGQALLQDNLFTDGTAQSSGDHGGKEESSNQNK
ncbi:MAG: DUF1804 family protein [Magnetococcales bacterium]|nr:DUF1804 family protein [Magnetococcales bacterium]